MQNCEPEKCERWEWFAMNQLPYKLFLPFAHLIEQTALIDKKHQLNEESA
jgi:hypothetical protein